MLTIVIALIVGMLAGFFSGNALNNMAWGSVIGVVSLLAIQISAGLFIRRQVNKVNNAIQTQLQEVQAKLQRKINMMQQRPGMSPKFLQSAVEKDQTQAVHKALEMTETLKKYYLWSPLLSKQISTMKMMFHYQIKEFDKVDALMSQCLFFDPTSSAMRIARMYRKNDPKLDKFAQGKLKRAKGEQAVLLFALYSWILVKRNDINAAIKVLADSKKRCANEVLNANWERLVNGKTKNFSNAALGEMWYMLYLEEPKVKTQRMRQQY
ncbi:MAG: hypothetical protein E7052_04035 [Lentisphaerae bacterium]|nr:hypothetical protein [Lentisphaerota bacterium]